MTKKRVELTIEENILKKAKRHLPNLSEFVEECLKHYFGYAEGTFPTGNANEITDKIGKLQTELFLMNQNHDVQENKVKVQNVEKDKTWRFLWNDYQVRRIPNKQLMEKAIEILETDAETLEDLLDEIYEIKDTVDTNNWNAVKETYKEAIE